MEINRRTGVGKWTSNRNKKGLSCETWQWELNNAPHRCVNKKMENKTGACFVTELLAQCFLMTTRLLILLEPGVPFPIVLLLFFFLSRLKRSSVLEANPICYVPILHCFFFFTSFFSPLRYNTITISNANSIWNMA